MAKARIPVVTISGGDGSSVRKAIVIKAPTTSLGSDEEFYYVRQRFPEWDIETGFVPNAKGRTIERLTLTKPGHKRRVFYFDTTSFNAPDEDRERREDSEINAASHFASSVASDLRNPVATNLSGIWTSGPDLTGITLQLEQKGNLITGHAANWGCFGYRRVDELTGVCRNGVVTLAVRHSSICTLRSTFRVLAKGGGIQLVARDGGPFFSVLFPSQSLSKAIRALE